MLQAIATLKANNSAVNELNMSVTKTGLAVTSDCSFPGLLTWLCGAGIINTPLNHSVIFIKEADITLTSDYWKVVLNFRLAPYEEAIEILRTDLAAVVELAHPTPLIEELHQVQTAVNSLESKLISLKQFLLKAERKIGWINAGGSFLKVLFGTHTTADLADLHATVDTLSQKQGDVIHAVNQQFTYFKQMCNECLV